MDVVEMIPKQLYAGGKPNAETWAFIQGNVSAILNVRDIQDSPPFPFYERLLIWAPILDKKAPDLPWVISVTNMANLLLDYGHILYIHDTAGINRLGFILTALFMRRFGCSLTRALYEVQQKKADTNPRPWYIALLRQYEAYLSINQYRGDHHGSR